MYSHSLTYSHSHSHSLPTHNGNQPTPQGLSCAGKLPLPGLLPIFTSLPLRVEYRLRINTPQPGREELD